MIHDSQSVFCSYLMSEKYIEIQRRHPTDPTTSKHDPSNRKHLAPRSATGGLYGLELLDLDGRPLRPKRVHSSHGSVRNLQGMEKDYDNDLPLRAPNSNSLSQICIMFLF